ncbi:MAG: hypothetical protein AAFX09_06630 [Pseudomonadota bacterium]
MSTAPVIRKRSTPRSDRGRAAEAWRWFSDRTQRAASAYRDLAWAPLLRQMAVSLMLILTSRIFPTEGFAPFALCAGVIWMAVLVRIALLKRLHER